MGCDVPPARDPQAGPTIVGVAPGEGAQPRNPTFRVDLDRPLAPLLPIGAVVIESGERRFPLSTSADPVTRSLEIRARSLPPDAVFRLEISGLVDLEGRVMAERVTVPFTTTGVVLDPPALPGFADARAILDRCASCHGEDGPLGLDLSSPDAIRSTAVGVPAREAASSPGGLRGLVRIAPGSPSLSYLIWKLSGDEHVPGGPLLEHDGIPLEDASVLVGWIRAGAPLEDRP